MNELTSPATGNYDSRIVANYIIENAERPVRQIGLNKLLYFAHGLFLVQNQRPLIRGYFEAWHYGPVHPAIYQAFKHHGREPITTKAHGLDLRTGSRKELPQLEDRDARFVVDSTLRSFQWLTDGQLVDLSHASGGPWDVIKRKSQSERMVGLRIPNELIREKFGMHKLSTCKLTESGDVYDDQDAPIAYHGFG